MTLTMQKIPMVETKKLEGGKADSLPAFEGTLFYMIGVNRRAIDTIYPSVMIEKVVIKNDKIEDAPISERGLVPVCSVATVGGAFELTEIIDNNGDPAVRILTQSELAVLRAGKEATNEALTLYTGC